MELAFKTYKVKGGKFFMDVSMAGNSMQKEIAFDGSKGYMVAQRSKMDLPAIWLQNLQKKSTEIFPELNFW